ncbi:MAG: hypothetical protein NTV23_09290 [Propionibacteriales bacterium]|nr:hypothetical protein [Propionibacteriales bacterium]
MDLTGHLDALGGVGRRADLVRRFGRTAVERAHRSGAIERVGRGRYVIAGMSDVRRRAAVVQGVLSMRSAAQVHGWAQKAVPRLPDVTVARTRHISAAEREIVVPHWSDLRHHDVDDGVTSKRRTLVDCMRMLPLEESLPIVESALRCGDVSSRGLREIAEEMRGRGRARARGVAAMASKDTANAYESVLHALAATVPGLNVRPQVRIRLPDGRTVRPDFVDLEAGIVIEAESFAWHGDSSALTRDCERYNLLVTLGFVVVRFSWPQVMFRPAYVLEVLAAAVTRARAAAHVV